MATQGIKRSAPEETELLEDVKAVLVNVDGTTTPATFVKDVVLPYIRENLKSHFEGHWDEEECKTDVTALREQAAKDKEENVEGVVNIIEGEDKDATIASLVSNVTWQMDQSRQSSALTQLQAHICREAYKSGNVQGKVFEDVGPAMREWVSEKRKVYVYSSESVEVQKMLFGHSSCGNIADLFSGHFDTTTGQKQDKETYKKIAAELSLDPTEILFLTGTPSEATPAAEAGMKTSLVVRGEGDELSDEQRQSFNVIETFAELTSASNGSAKRVEGEEEVSGDDVSADDATNDAEVEGQADEADSTEAAE